MFSQTACEILQSIAKSSCAPSSINTSFDGRLKTESSLKLSEAIRDELGVIVTALEVESTGSLSALSTLVESRLDKNRLGKTLVDIYLEVEQLAKEEYHPKIPYQWCARWNDFLDVGNWFSRADGLDAVEIVIRMEDTYEIKISDEDAAAMETVGQTVRYLWMNDSRKST
jgi:hypothetical protein